MPSLKPYQHGVGLVDAIEGSRYFLLGNQIIWTGVVKPQASSRPYTLRITHRFGKGKLPEVEVIDPALDLADGTFGLPHVYPGKRLCLYQRKYQEWTEQDLMSETILPWAVEWLYHYELWLVTGGTWLGGGEHPIVEKAISK